MHPNRTANPKAKCPRVKDKDLTEMIKKAWNAGWWCEKRPSNYVLCWPPDGQSRAVRVVSTPRGHRAVPNTRAAFARLGLEV